MTSESSNDSTVPSPGAPRWAARPVSGRLPDFPWDALVPMGDRARAHPDGIVDLSVGTPVDPTPAVVRQALADASDSPGYPLTVGTPTLRRPRRRLAGAPLRRRSASSRATCCPAIGSKELIAALPTPPRASAPATSSSPPRWPTRRTRSAPRWPAPAWSPPTR